MMRYRMVLKDFGKKTLEIRSGEVTDAGKIEIEVDGNRPPVRFIQIEWERENED